ncbi:hypothetical protein AVEN_44416-1 [Araneus ventricosus]|uniref:Uncharacterized protein n=1 Tax=Araneus ventricosus TaxID=182803 RepID=A0A4Y2WJB5_ARAVE|nr:hypothetical protein AVEN_44416-1 [Araneus ventricosus]
MVTPIIPLLQVIVDFESYFFHFARRRASSTQPQRDPQICLLLDTDDLRGNAIWESKQILSWACPSSSERKEGRKVEELFQSLSLVHVHLSSCT